MSDDIKDDDILEQDSLESTGQSDMSDNSGQPESSDAYSDYTPANRFIRNSGACRAAYRRRTETRAATHPAFHEKNG